MLSYEIINIIENAKDKGWVIEPEAKRIFSLYNLDVPRFLWTDKIEEAVNFAEDIGYPVVAKIVSFKVMHKSEQKGVLTGIEDKNELIEAFNRFQRIEGFEGIIVEEMFSGVELIVGAKNDYQFGPVVLFGLGGIWAEIYKDIILRMAPLREKDIETMTQCLKARPILEGYRGAPRVNFEEISRLLITFSDLIMELEDYFDSIDLNPVICSSKRCVIADARIILKRI